MIEKIKKEFIKRYKNTPLVFSSPGRVNLIGEHTDYNNGFVLPASVSKAIYFAIAPNNDNAFRFYAHDLSEAFTTTTENIERQDIAWANYLLGVIAEFRKSGSEIKGFDCVFGGNVPLGAGMSSSASIECGLAYALNHIYTLNYSTIDLVKFAQAAEHNYAGVQCGIMDQFAVMHGKKNSVIKLDCQSLQYDLFPLNMTNHILVLVNTGVKHALASSEYNDRRKECETGVAVIKKYKPQVQSLRDINLEMLNKHKAEMGEKVYQRCSYVIEENERLLASCENLQSGDLISFGKHMYGSHYGLRDKYEVSCQELDTLVSIAENIDGVIGARMMGGGFGGCTINLVEKTKVEEFERTVSTKYKTPEGKNPQIIEVEIEDGTKQIN